ncbi:MAG: hypothetical protein J6X94_00585 [Lachnospiraceae bacterium]|nr:hypothetical protein [Lachnospiraceae bacterium]
MEYKVALCIPTYERSDMIEDFLIKCSSYYIQEGIDIYYFDSSVSDETENLINSWPEKEHLFYLRFPSEVEGDEKACLIYQCYGLKREYDFIWLSNDSYQIQPETLHLLMTNLIPEYDMVNITPQKQDYDHNGLRVFTDPEDYFWACLYNVGRYGNAIVNRKTMLEGIDWDNYKYLFHNHEIQAFGNTMFYFTRLSELDHMRALYIPFFSSELRDSTLKKASNWRRNMFRIWCDSWVKAVEQMPDTYKNKKAIIFKFTSNMCMHDYKDFVKYRIEGIFDRHQYEKYKEVWERVTPTNKAIIWLISIFPRIILTLPRRVMIKARMIGFKRFYNRHPRIYIYGTSAGGYRYDLFLNKYGYKYEGFCCSQKTENQSRYCQHPVYELNELSDDFSNIGFIIAMQDENYNRVKQDLKRLGCKYFRDSKLENLFSFELGYCGDSWFIGKIR